MGEQPGVVNWDELADEALLSRIREGTHHAFAVLVRRHSRRFYALAYRFTGNRAEAEDIVQEALLKLWEQPDSFSADKGAKFTTWFYRVIVNRCLNWQKRAKPLPLIDDLPLADDSPDQEEMLGQAQRQHLLEKAIAALPERQRVAIELCVYQELSNAEAAEVMQLHLKALQSLLVRAKTSLKQQLQAVFEEPT